MQNIPQIILTFNEENELIETIFEYIDLYHTYYPNSVVELDFKFLMKESVIDVVMQPLLELYNKDDLYDIIENLYMDTIVLYHKIISPPRSSQTYIRNKPNINKMSLKLDILRNKPQPEQRSIEWYKFRYNLITASNAWKGLDTESNRNQLIVEKCKPLDYSKNISTINLDTPFHHGQKFEPLSVMVYEDRYNTKVEDFGCIKHDKYEFLGASPDGINVDKKSKRYGRMLEIKNIFNRDIISEPKKEYWIQMQLQMEVCDLNDCDFLETRFIEYENFKEFENDGTWNKTSQNKLKGVYLLFIDNGSTIYEYCPLNFNQSEFEEWEKNKIAEYGQDKWFKNGYWYLDEFSCKLVLRNKQWFNYAIPLLSDTWKIIEQERISGYSHRLPKQRQKKPETTGKCLIKINTSS